MPREDVVEVLDSSECHLHYYDFRHSLADFIFIFIFDTQKNEFPINLGTFKINYFLPKLLESYSIGGIIVNVKRETPCGG